MKKIYGVLAMIIAFGGLCLFSEDVKASDFNESELSTYGVIFKEEFNNGISNWRKDGDVRVEQKNGNKYVYLRGMEDCTPIGGGCYPQLAAMQTTLGGLAPGKTYKFSIKAIGIGKISVNSSGYQISVNDGNANLDIDNAKTYSTNFTADGNGNMKIMILAYGTKMLVDDIQIEN